MSSKEYFAAKLASGTAAASKMALWWPKHGHASMELLAACSDVHEDIQRAEKAFLLAADEWEAVVPSAQPRRAGADVGLMCEHTLLEIDLIYAMVTGHPGSIQRLTERMVDNAKVHATRYVHAMPGFPGARFGQLLQEHVELFLEAVRSRCERNVGAALKCAKAMDNNSVALAALTAEWF